MSTANQPPSGYYFSIKAYLPDGTLIKSKQLPITAEAEYYALIFDCILLGCSGFWLKNKFGSKYYPFKKLNHPSTSLRSVIQSAN